MKIKMTDGRTLIGNFCKNIFFLLITLFLGMDTYIIYMLARYMYIYKFFWQGSLENLKWNIFKNIFFQ